MGFGGGAQAMITILKNNEKMKAQRSRSKGLSGSYENIKLNLDYPKATPKMLRDIREQKIQDRKRTLFNQFLLVCCILVVLSIMIYFMF
ncbi:MULTISPECIES: hypothetical protein [unclassified Mangrovimonas]|uniref:hypothetical protein n=1 Tax=unclassified Mangrovimonas TaxID=2622855 RepID=UPI0006B450DE|nr:MULTISPECIES: hypothetical protein [unclassified Mangrovimonas]NIK91326.1 hypothetical protein [Mangrovimonas sp. CR14]